MLYAGINFLHFARFEHYSCWKDKQDHGYCTVDYNHRGRMTMRIDDGPTRRLQGPVAFFSFPGTRFRYGSRDARRQWSQHYVAFKGPRIEDYVAAGLFERDPARAIRPVVNPVRLLAAFDELHAELEKPDLDERRAVWLLDGLLIELERQRRQAGSTADAPFEALRRRILEHPAAPWDFTAEARQMGCSERHLRRLFQDRCGCPPSRFVQRIRLERAAARLRSSDWSIAGIARWVGYRDVAYFTRLFKRSYGLPPAAYRTEFT